MSRSVNRRRSREEVSVAVEIEGELRAGEPFVRLRIAFDNQCDDHRVRVHVPLPEPAQSTERCVGARKDE